MASAFEVTAKQVADLPHEFAFVELVNRLIWDECQKRHLPAEAARLTLRIHDPDGGADAVVDAADRPGTYIPPGLTVWQFKPKWLTEKKLQTELQKPAVQDAFKGGAGYVLVNQKGMAASLQVSRQKKLADLAKAAGCSGPVLLYVSDHVAHWASTVPAVILTFHPPFLAQYFRADEFLRLDQRHSTEFSPDDRRVAIIESIRIRVFSDAAVSISSRIQGKPGVGKSRLGLELVRALGIADLTLYGPQVPSTELIGWIAANPDVHATLVIDECDEVVAAELAALAHQCDGRLRLITIGPGDSAGADVYQVEVLPTETMEQVVRSVSSTLTGDQVRWVAERTEGYVKLAVVVAQAIAAGIASIDAMTTYGEIVRAVERLLLESADGKRMLTGMALLSRVGWEGDVSAEGQGLAAFMGVPWASAEQEVAQALDRGVVVRRGRYRYVSPELLAVWLAADFWKDQGHRIGDLAQLLPTPASKESLMERLSQLGDVPAARQVLEELLGADGPFRDIGSIESPAASRTFATIARGAREAGIEALLRLFESASAEDLRKFEAGRRDVIFLLEEYAQYKETFFSAARLLLRLAEGENETWSNNATGVWRSLFLTFLGQTEVPPIERHQLIVEALDSHIQTRRRLAVEAIGTALQGHEMARTVRSQSVPREHWTPKTVGDVREVKRHALSLIDRVINDSDEGIRDPAIATLLANARSLVEIGLADEAIGRIAGVEGSNESQSRSLWEAIEDVLRYESESLTREQKETLKKASKRIYGDSIVDRVRRYCGPWSHVDWDPEHPESPPETIAASLADELAAQPEQLVGILPWLFSGRAENAWTLGLRLGELDSDRRYFALLQDAARQGPDPRVLSTYLAGRATAGDSEWREAQLDAWALSDEMSAIVFDATVRGPPSDRGATRLLSLVERGLTPASQLGWLRVGNWASSVSVDTLALLVTELIADGSAAGAQAAFVLLLEGASDRPESSQLTDLSWQALEQPAARGNETMLAYYWARLANRLVGLDAGRIANIIAEMLANNQIGYRDERMKVLARAFQIDPAAAWVPLGARLIENRGFLLHWTLEEDGLIVDLPVAVIENWLSEVGSEGAKVLAQSVKPSGHPQSDIVRLLLNKYASDVRGILAANFRSGMWWGSEAGHLQQLVLTATNWLEDESPSVRAWAQDLITDLRRQIPVAKAREEEMDLLYR
jgi:hypothetical protein